VKPGAAAYEQNSERIFELLYARRESWLRDAAGFGRFPKMLLLRNGKQEFQFVDHGGL